MLIPTDVDFLQNEYNRKFEEERLIDKFYSPYVFEEENPIRAVIHDLKYNKNFSAGIFLGEKIAEKFSSEISTSNYDFIIPIPLHPLKKAERGYNQSFYIARGISKITKIKISNKFLKRKRYTSTQTKLSASERKENIRNAFVLRKPNKINGKNLIIVDDVTTTGATVSEAARLLKKAGASKILLLTAAIPMI